MVGQRVAFGVEAHDSDLPSQVLTYSLQAGSPGGAVIDATSGMFTWTPNLAQRGTNFVTVRVTDNGTPPLSATQSFAVIVQIPNQPPTILPVADLNVSLGQTVSLRVIAQDSDQPAQTLTFSLLSGSPTGAAISPAGDLGWTPTSNQIGTNFIHVQVTDNGVPPLSANVSFTAVVHPMAQGPEVSAKLVHR